jgi:digeranylgeranylglycerophospholipid reductase
MKYDVVIIGAGPAGLMAARTLNGKLKYLVIDSKEEIGVPLHCAEGLRQETFKKFFGDKKYSFVKNTVKGHKVIYKDLTRLFNEPFVELDRKEFEKWMASPLKNIKLSTRFEDLEIKNQGILVRTDKGIIEAKLAILCNGTNFNVQRKLKLIKEKPTVITGYGGIYKNHNLDPNYFYYLFDDDYLGYFWIFPKDKETANIGFGAFDSKENPKKSLNKLLKKFNFKAKQISEYGGLVPCSGPIYKTYSDRLLICGNAAGQVYAGTGEGISFALEAGKIAGEVALDADKKNNFSRNFLRVYEKRWKREFSNQMEAGKLFGFFLALGYKYGIYKKLFSVPTDDELKSLIIEGRLSKRAKIAFCISKILLPRIKVTEKIKKEPLPKGIKLLYFLYKKLKLR